MSPSSLPSKSTVYCAPCCAFGRCEDCEGGDCACDRWPHRGSVQFWRHLPERIRMWSPWWLRHVLAVERESHNRTLADLRAAREAPPGHADDEHGVGLRWWR